MLVRRGLLESSGRTTSCQPDIFGLATSVGVAAGKTWLEACSLRSKKRQVFFEIKDREGGQSLGCFLDTV